jgi:methionine-gamma-lyase
MKKSSHFDTNCTTNPEDPITTPAHQLPIYALSAFSFPSAEAGSDIFAGEQPGYIYGRFGNPTVYAVANKIARLESYGSDLQAAALLTGSGMAAIALPMMALLRPGQAILTQRDLYGGTTELMQKVLQPMQISAYYHNLRDLTAVEQLLKDHPEIGMIYLETPANPVLRCVDLAGLARLARQYNCYTLADNTLCSPAIQRPLLLGIDLVAHSATKYLNGHGNSIAGAIIGSDALLIHNRLLPVLRLMGWNANPWDAWLLHNGLKTLAIRMRQHNANAQQLAFFLEKHPAVEQVNYPSLPNHPDRSLIDRQMYGGGGMLSFAVRGGEAAARLFMNRLKLATLAATFGDVDTLVMHPASMSHRNIPQDIRESEGISASLVRMSVGIEAIEDIIADVEQALEGL